MKVLFISRPTLFTASGGDTVQIKETASELKKLGVDVDIRLANEKINYNCYDIIHFFNIIRPNTISAHVKNSNLPFLISTIFVDYSEIERSERSFIFKLLSKIFGADGTDYFKTIGRLLFNGEGLVDNSYILRGHRKSVELLLNSADTLLPNSMNEFLRLKERYNFRNTYTKIPNGVSKDFLESVDDHQKKDLVLCIGRIEFIKNQLNLIRALKNSNIELHIIGKPAPNHKAYYEQCKKEATSNIKFIGQISKSEVIERLIEAKVHVLPSWFETTGLSTIEAASLGCNIVISKKGDTEEYFRDFAHYCKPDKPESIKKAIQEALTADFNPNLKQLIQQNYTWNKAAEITLQAYHKVLNT